MKNKANLQHKKQTCDCRTNCFKYSLFPCTLNDWFNLDLSIRNSKTISIFKSKLLYFAHPVQNNIFNIFDPEGLKLLRRPRFHCHHFTLYRIDLMNSLKSICNSFESTTDNNKITLLLYGDSHFDGSKNELILQSSIKYIKTDSPDRFSNKIQ